MHGLAVYVKEGLPFARDLSLENCADYDYSRADWDGLCDDLRDIPREDIFKLSASAAASKFCEWVQVGIDVYIPHLKYQIKIEITFSFLPKR